MPDFCAAYVCCNRRCLETRTRGITFHLSKSYEEYEETTSQCSKEGDEDEDLALAIYESLQPVEVPSDGCVVVQDEEPHIVISDDGNLEEKESEPDVMSILKNISSQLDTGEHPQSNNVNVTRDSVLESAFRTFRRQRFSPAHRLNVVFVDTDGITEGAVDDGGPTREFLRLLVVAIKDSIYFYGQEDKKNLSLVSRALDAGEYRFVGQMLSVALIHGGIKPSFFSERLYCSVSSLPTPQISVEEVEDWELWEKLQKIQDAETLQDARDAVMEASSLLGLLGCPGFLNTMEQRHALVQEAARAYVEGRTQKALEQLVDGLKPLGVAEAIVKHPGTLKPLFVGGPKRLEMQDLLDLFSICFSDPGSNRRRLENRAMMFWKDWLIEVDEGTRPVTLEQILIFASGTDSIPPLGFSHRPNIEFLHCNDGNQKLFPEANTCQVILRLPLHPSYSIFVEYVESGILQSPTFGFI
ncbi:G2/M phase-specific E3 ubiquitin-protein ligase-like isoform X2 [Paramormyrops kingsleyae]|uniref:G2/M phase-specific E3 ubiquitin-protein ligase-like isoform X2 n=1 Tax=Paramormyrops kingsleyae TaxID=1676925 RepID=UPI003B96A7AA